MKKEQISAALSNISDRHVEEMLDFQPQKRASAWIKWGGTAAAFLLVAVIAIVVALQVYPPQAPPPTADEGSFTRNYKGNINTSEMALLWPWEYKTVTERYYFVLIDGIEYYASAQTVAPEQVEHLIDRFPFVGRDDYEENKEYREHFEVYAIRDISVDACVAVKAEGKYYVYASEEGRALLSTPEIRQFAGRVTEIGEGYVMIDDTEICKDPEEGMTFRILTDDPRVSRCFAFSAYGIRVGSLIVVSFDVPITIGEGNTVAGAIDVNIGHLAENGDVLIPE